MIEMLGVDIGDDGNIGRQFQERAVALVRLDHHPVARAEAGIGAERVDDAAIDDGRVEAAGVEQGRDHRGRGGLAVGAGNGDAGFQPHQFGQHLGTAHDRNAPSRERRRVRDCPSDGGRDHHNLGHAEILRGMADGDGRAAILQPLDRIALGGVRALHLVAEVQQNLGDAGHADAADADEMDGTDVAGAVS
jgi:hypothetical protein